MASQKHEGSRPVIYPRSPHSTEADIASRLIPARLTSWDVTYALNIAIASAISYWVTTHTPFPITDKDSELLGGMWAAVATVFVFRSSRNDSLSAGVSRLIATGVSFALCIVYLWFLPFTVGGLALLIGAGTLVMMVLDQRDDIVTTAITTVVVMVVAAISPDDAWRQPILRLLDTIVGVGIGIGFKWIASLAYSKIVRWRVR
jgi:uncharacterized membrane protein YccC